MAVLQHLPDSDEDQNDPAAELSPAAEPSADLPAGLHRSEAAEQGDGGNHQKRRKNLCTRRPHANADRERVDARCDRLYQQSAAGQPSGGTSLLLVGKSGADHLSAHPAKNQQRQPASHPGNKIRSGPRRQKSGQRHCALKDREPGRHFQKPQPLSREAHGVGSRNRHCIHTESQPDQNNFSDSHSGFPPLAFARAALPQKKNHVRTDLPVCTQFSFIKASQRRQPHPVDLTRGSGPRKLLHHVFVIIAKKFFPVKPEVLPVLFAFGLTGDGFANLTVR